MSASYNRLYDLLGNMLDYPETTFHGNLDECLRELEADASPSLRYLRKFAEFARHSSLNQLQELYTQTFDINPQCALEVGWHLYGESYERGNFIVKMRHILRQLGVRESKELPDHLTHVIKAVGRMPRPQADRFAREFLLSTLRKMCAGLKGRENPYEHVLKGIECEIEQRHLVQTEEGVHND